VLIAREKRENPMGHIVATGAGCRGGRRSDVVKRDRLDQVDSCRPRRFGRSPSSYTLSIIRGEATRRACLFITCSSSHYQYLIIKLSITLKVLSTSILGCLYAVHNMFSISVLITW
jgi:hypothetical protein